MRNHNFNSICKVFTVFFCVLSLNAAWGEERSVWQRFVNFFTPSGSIQGNGPIFDELKGVESQIDKIEVQYTRERRPGNKTRYRKQLDSLRSVRDSLVTVIETMSSGALAVSSSSTVSPVMSNAMQSSAALSSANVAVSSSSVEISSSAIDTVLATATVATVTAVPTVASAETACVHDTVFVHDTLVVRDTVVIRDTLYVVLANKPEAPAPKEKKKADKTSGK